MQKESIRDKAHLFQGADKWHLNHSHSEKQIRMADGPSGLRIEKKQKPGFAESYRANVFPSASCAACSFDEDLLEEYGRMLGQEAACAGADLLLGPGVNHKRSPLCGRNFEYYSEDPLLSGKLGSAFIRGVQSAGVGACLKHLAANSRERARLTMNSVVDERTLHELYLRAFETAVREGKPAAVMPAYNLLNGIHCCEDRKLLDEVRSWGFDGLFISDWGAVSSPVEALRAGLNVEMPGGNIGADDQIVKAVQDGRLSEQEVSVNAERIHSWISRFDKRKKQSFDQEEHLHFIERAAEESAVLLKNAGALPLKRSERIAVISPFADDMLNQGEGSAHVHAIEKDSFLDALKETGIVCTRADGFRKDSAQPDSELEKEAMEAAEGQDTVIFLAGFTEGEGRDRSSMQLPQCQLSLLHKLTAVKKKLIVVLFCGGPVDVSWRDDADAILCMHYGGMRSGRALTQLLYGYKNPCGHLAETWPLHQEDTPASSWYSTSAKESQYREAIFSGYRYYTTFSVPCAWPFGYGLSYTCFEVKNYYCHCQNDWLVMEMNVMNTGSYDGSCVVQIYSSMPGSRISRPLRQLIAFQKIYLKKGENRQIRLEVPVSRLAYWDVKKHEWSVEEGWYDLAVCENAEKVIAHQTVRIHGNSCPYSLIRKSYFHIENGNLKVADADFEAMLGHSLPVYDRDYFTADTTLEELKKSGLGRVVCRVIELFLKVHPFEGADPQMVLESPLRQILWIGHGVTWETTEQIVKMMNHPDFRKFVTILCSLKKEGKNLWKCR